MVFRPCWSQGRSQSIQHSHSLSGLLTVAVVAIVGGRHRPCPCECEGSFRLTVCIAASVSWSSVRVCGSDAHIRVTGIGSRRQWHGRWRQVCETVRIEVDHLLCHWRHSCDHRRSDIRGCHVLGHRLHRLVAAIIGGHHREGPHEGVRTFCLSICIAASVDRGRVHMGDLDGHIAVAVVCSIGNRGLTTNGCAGVRSAEWIDVHKQCSGCRDVERGRNGIQYGHQAVDLYCMLIATIVCRRRGVGPLQGECTRAWEASVLLWTVHVVSCDFHIFVTVVRRTGCWIWHPVDVVCKAIRIGIDDRVSWLSDKQYWIHCVHQLNALAHARSISTAVGGRVHDVVSAFTR